MPREADAETIPLLRSPFHNAQYTTSNNGRRSLFSYIGYGFIIAATLLFTVNMIFYFNESNEIMSSMGVSKIPYEYYLGLKESNELEYVVETSPPSDPTFSKLFEEDDNTISNLKKDLSYDRLKLAEIVTKNYKTWNPVYYEVRENRYEPENFENFAVLTTKSYMSGLWFNIWTPKVRISFVSSEDSYYYNEGGRFIYGNEEGREPGFVYGGKNEEVNKLLNCEYEISWTYKYFGEIYRKCSNREPWDKVAYVKGTSEWGMQWLDPEGVDTYGIVTKPAYGENKRMRNVIIQRDAPFPPILPALYLAYYDRIIVEDDSNSLL